MKKSKILSLVLAMAMITMLALPMAASAASDATITVNGPTSLTLTNTDFSAYKLFDVTVSGTAPNINYAYTPVAAVATFLATRTATYGTDLKAYLESTSPAPNLTQLTKDLNDSGLFTAITPPAQVSGTSVKFSNLDYGYYLVVGKGKAPGPNSTTVDVIAHHALITVDALEKDGVVNLKADAPSITKQVDNAHNGTAWDNHTDKNIGDLVNFKLTTAVPDMTGYTSYTFTVRDIMSPGLTFNSSIPVQVSVGGSAYANTNYTLTTTVITAANLATIPGAVAADVGGTYIEVKFTPSEFIKLTKGAAIQILYSANVNKDAVMAPGNNPNTVWLTYSNNPYSGGTGDSVHTTVYVYTFQVNVNKIDGKSYDKDGTIENLAGAVFNLRATSGGAAMNLVLVDAGSATTPAVYRLPTANDAAGTLITDMTTPASGLVDIKGLDAGTYYLYEKTAPLGYNKLTSEITVNIVATYSTDGATVVNKDVGDATPSFVIPEEQVKNYAGGQLPPTGGIGTAIFYAAGGLLAAGLIAFFAIRRRKNILDVK